MTLDDIRLARERIADAVHCTPVLTCRSLDAMAGCQLFCKCENFQKAGAFKFRGACNAVLSLSEAERQRGVVTHSSGNHAGALALAARQNGAPAYIVMPTDAPAVKQAAVRGYGAEITFCEPTLAAREATAGEVIGRTGGALIHPYNDDRIIAGQGTAALELLDAAPELDVLITPLGGGGLLSGTAVATKALRPQTRVYGAEPEGADDAFRSLQAGRIIPSTDPKTIADGLRTSLGDRTFPLIQRYVDGIVTVSDNEISDAMRHVWERMKIVIEPSAAVPLAAILSGRMTVRGQRVGLVFSGGNVDLGKLPWRQV